MKAINFHNDIPSIPTGNFKDKILLGLDLPSMQLGAEIFHQLNIKSIF